MDAIDKKILNIIQTRFPLEPEPYKAVGAQIGLSEDDVFARVKKLKEKGIIRRIGAVFDLGELGFASTLCAARVPEDKIRIFVDAVNSYPGVTHNYRRNHAYNIWFTFIAPTMDDIEKALREISDTTGITDILNMSAKRKFKIDASFEL
ncbi:MAG: AsnC family transcriptional regulator [Deltaproteobacteria bacterium]|nr:AsnC family transcriptional regulator [Deltaproteobacteria bacterium]